MIRLDNLEKKYGDKTALKVDTIEIPVGQNVGLVGNNGAGKTTMLSLILDLIQPNSGTAYLNKLNVAQDESWKKITGSYLDENFLIEFLKTEEYFEFISKLHQWNEDDLNELFVKFEPLFNGEVLNQKKFIRDFSKGNKKKIGISSAFIGNPEIIILDEPFANLDPTSQIKLKELLRELSGSVTMLISSHDLSHVTDVSERIIVLEDGFVIKDIIKTPETLKELEEYFSHQ